MAKSSSSDWKDLLPAIGLIALVLGVLALTATVKTDQEPEWTRPEPEGVDRPALLTPPPSDHPGDPMEEKAAEPATAPERSARIPGRKGGTLDDRARDDYKRLTGMPDRWTWQLMVSCDPENSLRHVQAMDWADEMYVLPTELKGQACYRLCWGLYDSREQAESDGGMPSYLSRNFQGRRPKSLAEIHP